MHSSSKRFARKSSLHTPDANQPRSRRRQERTPHLHPHPVPFRKQLFTALLCRTRESSFLPAENAVAIETSSSRTRIEPLCTGNRVQESGAGAGVGGDDVGGECEGGLADGQDYGVAAYGESRAEAPLAHVRTQVAEAQIAGVLVGTGAVRVLPCCWQ